MLVFVLLVNVFVFIAQTSITKTNTDSEIFSPYAGSWASEYDTGNYTLSSDPAAGLPDTINTGESSGNIFTDSWNTLKTWFTNAATGTSMFARMVSGPTSLLIAANVPPEISFIIGFFWNVLSIFLVVAFIRGGSQL